MESRLSFCEALDSVVRRNDGVCRGFLRTTFRALFLLAGQSLAFSQEPSGIASHVLSPHARGGNGVRGPVGEWGYSRGLNTVRLRTDLFLSSPCPSLGLAMWLASFFPDMGLSLLSLPQRKAPQR